MELWNDYEGKTVDGRYRLDRLVAPKGRSALFQTTDESGAPAMIRLIESLNDEREILERWNAARVLQEEHLTHILQCGKTVLDGVHLVYAVMEPFDAELADILKERPLTADEAKEVASSVAAALVDLHAHGLVHEHVEPSQVVARGEVVKLRSDLVREAGEGAEAAALRKRDAYDLAVLIQETVTRRRESGGSTLPAPLDEMVRNGRSGAWGVSEMAAVLRPAPGPWVGANGSSQATGNRAVAASGGVGSRGAGSATRGAESANNTAGGTSVPAGVGAVTGRTASAPAHEGPAPGVPAGAAVGSARAASAGVAASDAAANAAGLDPAARPRPALVRDRIVMDPEEPIVQRKGLWAIAAVALLGAVLLFWHFGHSGKQPAGTGPVAATPAAATAVNPPVDTAQSGVPADTRPTKPSAARTGRERPGYASVIPPVSAASRTPARTAAADGEVVGAPSLAASPMPHDAKSAWRVVAFTYNREDQAKHKAESVAQQHPDLKPEVFAPKSGSPYLVALGGWMSSADAQALRERARSEGLPHDTYVQNFKNH